MSSGEENTLLKSPASIRNCVGCLLIVSAMLRWMSGIRYRSSGGE